jgi:DNA modification methylase
MVAYPNTLYMCCPTGDGAAAAILVSEDKLKQYAAGRKRAKVAASVTPQGLAGTAHTDAQLAALAAEINGAGDGAGKLTGDPDETPGPPPEPVTQPGDIWQLGRHRLICGDCFDPAVMKALTGGQRANMALMDPPYAIYGSSTGVASEVADDAMVRPFFEAMWRVIAGHVVMFAHCYVHCDWRSWAAVWESAKRARLTPQNMLVWDKGGWGMGDHYANTHELIAFFARIPPKKMTMAKPVTGQRPVYSQNILRHDRPRGEDRQHNAAKPVAMHADLIGNSTDPDGTVLDLFAGSGTVMIAAEKAGRTCWAAEKEPSWCDVIVQRFTDRTGITPARLEEAP